MSNPDYSTNRIWPDDYINKVICGDCLTVMKGIPDGAVDLVVTDPPYGITANKWDVALDLQILWSNLCRVSTLYLITASQPFSSRLVMSASELFKHEWIWQKNRGGNFANTVREPFKEHEHVMCFASQSWTYNPQHQTRAGSGADRVKYKFTATQASENYGKFNGGPNETLPIERGPSSIQKFNTETGLHPTQKPVGLFEYLIKTYSNPGDIILDPFAGSGTTLVAAKQLGRKYIGIEINPDYCAIAEDRLRQEELF